MFSVSGGVGGRVEENKELDYLDYLGLNGGMIIKLFRNQ
jgi:hypothetical protein